jgi:general secretion pathway protein F
MRSKAISAAIYPAILIVVGSAVTLFLLGFVVPRFATVYEEAGRQVSFLTSLLMGWGRLVARHGDVLLLGLPLAAVAGAAAWRLVRARYAASDLLGKLPWLHRQVHNYELSRLYMTVGLLLSGGIPLVRALHMVEATVGADTRARLRRAVPRIAAGESFSAAMSAEGLVAAVALRLFRVGERAGNLGEMLIRAARYYDGEVTRFVERFTRAAEPILMAAIGIVVGTIVVLLYLPIFELAGSLQ